MRTYRPLFSLMTSSLLGLVIAGCGGGNDSGGTTGTGIDVITKNISRMVVYGTSVDIQVSVRSTDPLPAGAIVTASDPDKLFMPMVSTVLNSDGSYTLTLTTSATAPADRYNAHNVTLKICNDVPCSTHQEASIPFDVNVMTPASAWPGNHLSPLAAWPGVAEWGTFQANAAHTGYVPAQTNPNAFSTRWQFPVATDTLDSFYLPSATVTTANNQFFVAGNNALFARQEFDGTSVWQYSVSSLAYPSTNPPAVANGVVYMAAGQQSSTYMFAFNAATGLLVFKSPMSAQWENYLAPTIGTFGIYTNAGTYGGLYAFLPSGQQAFFANMDQTDMWTPAVDASGVYAYTGGVLKVLDPQTGAVTHSISDPSFTNYIYAINGSPVVGAAGSVFVANYANSKLNGGGIGNTLLKFNVNQNSIGWQIPGDYPTTPAYNDGVLYVANERPVRLEARSETDGSLLWSWIPPQAGDTGFNSEVLLTGNLVFVSTNLATYAIDISTHRTVWSYPLAGKLALSKNGVLYIEGGNFLTTLNLK